MDKKKRAGAPDGNRNRAKGEHQRSFVSLSGPANDKIINGFISQGIEPSTQAVKEAVMEAVMDWDIFGFFSMPDEDLHQRDMQYEEEKEEERSLAIIRADYQAFRYLESASIEELRKIVAEGPFPVNPETGKRYEEGDYQENDHLRGMGARYLRWYRQAVIVLEQRDDH